MSERPAKVLDQSDLKSLVQELHHLDLEMHEVLLWFIRAARLHQDAPEVDKTTEFLEAVARHLPGRLEICLELLQASPQGERHLSRVQRDKLLDPEQTLLSKALDELPILRLFAPLLDQLLDSLHSAIEQGDPGPDDPEAVILNPDGETATWPVQPN